MNHALSLAIIFSSATLLGSEPPLDLSFSKEERGFFDYELTLPSAFPPINESQTLLSPVKIQVQTVSDGEWDILFTFPSSVKFQAEEEDGDFFVSFNQGVDSKDTVVIYEKLGFLLEELILGYHSFAFCPSRKLSYQASSHNNTFTLRVKAIEQDLARSKIKDLSLARLFIKSRNDAQSRRFLKELEKEYPGCKEVSLLNASLESVYPNWKKQYNTLSSLQKKYPEDERVHKLLREVYSPHSPFGNLERQAQITQGLSVVQVNKGKGEMTAFNSPKTTIFTGGVWQLSQSHIHSVVGKEGKISSFNKIRNQGSLYSRIETDEGLSATLYLYGQKRGLGIGAKCKGLLPWIQGEVIGFAAWHKPYWSLFETQAFHGKEDRLELSGSFVQSCYIKGSFLGAFHRVGITGTETGFYSALTNINIFGYIRTVSPMIAINYGLDAEYILYEKVKEGVSGPYKPIPYDSFENHSLRGYLFWSVRTYWHSSLFGGGTINRITGIISSTYGVSIKYVKPCPYGLEMELSATHFPSTIVENAASEYFTAKLTGRF